MRKKQQSRTASTITGIALIEALVALIVVSVGLLGLVKLETVLIASSADARARAEAMTLAQSKLDQLRHYVLQGEHFVLTGSPSTCAEGTVVTDGSDTATGVNVPLFTRTWAVTPDCTNQRHRILVTVAWADADNAAQSVNLNTVMAWNDPAATASSLGGGSGAGSLLQPASAKLVNEGAEQYTGTGTPGSDGTISFKDSDGFYKLAVPDSAGKLWIRLVSPVPLVQFSGIVAKHPDATGLRITDVATYRTDVTFCLFPLKFTFADTPSTYGLDGTGAKGVKITEAETASNAELYKAAAYTCYVPEGWYGNVGLVQNSYSTNTSCTGQYRPFDGADKAKSSLDNTNCNYYTYLACPQDNVPFQTGVRAIKILYKDLGSNVVGQTGLTQGYETISMKNGKKQDDGATPLSRLSRIDFAIYKPSSSDFSSCYKYFYQDLKKINGSIPLPGSKTATYAVEFFTGAPYDSTTDPETSPNNGLEGTPSIVYPSYVVDVLTKEWILSGTVSSSCTGVSVNPTTTSGCQLSGGAFSCRVPHNWKGTVDASPSGSGSSVSVTTGVTSNQSVGVLTCP